MPEIVAGDFSGYMVVGIGVLWAGARADKFKHVTLNGGSVTYMPQDIRRVKEIQADKVEAKGALAGAAAGALLLGPLGALVGAAAIVGNSDNRMVGIEFSDGKKVVVKLDGRDKAFECLEQFARMNKLMEIDF